MARKYKRATAPLDETARARLWLEVSSGVSGETTTTSDTAELADLIDSFYNEEEIDKRKGKFGMGSEKGGYLARRSLDAVLAESEADVVAHRIRVAAERGVTAVSPAGDGFKRRVMGWLRDEGFDAGGAEGIQAGNHEYIDVIDRGGTRYILEIDLAAEFEIARPTQHYTVLLRALPSVFVGRPGALESIVSLMCAAMEESIRSSGMHQPPWRRKEYVQAKWFSSYRRNSATDGERKGGPADRGGSGSFCSLISIPLGSLQDAEKGHGGRLQAAKEVSVRLHPRGHGLHGLEVVGAVEVALEDGAGEVIEGEVEIALEVVVGPESRGDLVGVDEELGVHALGAGPGTGNGLLNQGVLGHDQLGRGWERSLEGLQLAHREAMAPDPG
ncbi:hypothetical protein GW17_00029932 [Ensete ventricosum]|nr:hypothetical protein GW17_00029932 [Ensete ventricosum]